MSHLTNGPLLDAVIGELIPDHVQAEYPKYVEFIRHIAKFLEIQSKAGYHTNRLVYQRDIDLVDEEFLSELQNEIGSAVPRSFAANPYLFYRKLGELYRSRGTPGSIEAFFRLLYNDEVELYFPREHLFKPSDGTWFDQTAAIEASPASYNPQFTFTAGASQAIFTGVDDHGGTMKFDNPLVFIDGVQTTAFTPSAAPNTGGTALDYFITLDSALTGGEVVDIYETGLYTTTRGFPSDVMKLQDSFFYQKFSYVVRTGTDGSIWNNAFNRLIHPAGFIFFSEIFIIIDLLGGIIPGIQPGWQTYGAPILLIPSNNPVAGAVSIGGQEYNVVIEPNQSNAFGPAQYLEQLKFYFSGSISAFENYTIQEAIDLKLPFNMDAEITLSP